MGAKIKQCTEKMEQGGTKKLSIHCECELDFVDYSHDNDETLDRNEFPDDEEYESAFDAKYSKAFAMWNEILYPIIVSKCKETCPILSSDNKTIELKYIKDISN